MKLHLTPFPITIESLRGFPVSSRIGTRRFQTGLSLLELMVGITIGLLVVLAALGTVQFTRSSTQAVSANAQLQQSANTVMLLIGDQIKQTGAANLIRTPDTPASGTVAAASSPAGHVVYDISYTGVTGQAPSSAARISIRGEAASAALPGSSNSVNASTLTISYAPSAGNNRNCIGSGPVGYPATPPAGGASSLQVVSRISMPNVDGSLQCGDGINAAQPVVQGAQEFVVTYLTHLADGNIASRTAAQVEDAGDWSSIDAVAVCLHLASDPVGLPDYVLPQKCNGNANVNITDRRLHRVFQQVFYLRNRG